MNITSNQNSYARLYNTNNKSTNKNLSFKAELIFEPEAIDKLRAEAKVIYREKELYDKLKLEYDLALLAIAFNHATGHIRGQAFVKADECDCPYILFKTKDGKKFCTSKHPVYRFSFRSFTDGYKLDLKNGVSTIIGMLSGCENNNPEMKPQYHKQCSFNVFNERINRFCNTPLDDFFETSEHIAKKEEFIPYITEKANYKDFTLDFKNLLKCDDSSLDTLSDLQLKTVFYNFFAEPDGRSVAYKRSVIYLLLRKQYGEHIPEKMTKLLNKTYANALKWENNKDKQN